jgi:hypothetical protein
MTGCRWFIFPEFDVGQARPAVQSEGDSNQDVGAKLKPIN